LSAEAEVIQGSMTLGDVIETTGVTLDLLVRELGLPADISTDDRLGRVARDNGISVAEVREVVERGMAGTLGDPLVVPESEMMAPSVSEEPLPTPEEEHDDHAEGMAGLADVRGSMTLGEIVALGVPREVLYRELRIPAGTSVDERLGRLGRTYGFSMTQVRDLVEAHR
jgi:hypothetical protein